MIIKTNNLIVSNDSLDNDNFIEMSFGEDCEPEIISLDDLDAIINTFKKIRLDNYERDQRSKI